MKQIIILSIVGLTLAGCSARSRGADIHPDVRPGPAVVQYHPGMSIPESRPYINPRNGNVHSMYEPIVHCHDLRYPNRPVQKVCRIVR